MSTSERNDNTLTSWRTAPILVVSAEELREMQPPELDLWDEAAALVIKWFEARKRVQARLRKVDAPAEQSFRFLPPAYGRLEAR